MRREILGQHLRIGVVALHAERQRLGASQHEPRIHRPEDRAFGVLDELQPLDVDVAHRDDDSADAVAVPVQKLRRAVDDEVGAEVDRPLDRRAGERVVDDDDDVTGVRDRTGSSEVGESQRRVRRRLEEQHPRVGADGGFDRLEIGRVDVGEIELILPQHALEQSIRAAVGIVGDDDVIAGLEERHHGAGRSHARGKRERGSTVLDRGKVGLEGDCASGSACARTRSPCACQAPPARRSRSDRSG